MRIGRLVSTVAAAAAVGGCAVLVAGMGRATVPGTGSQPSETPVAAGSSIPIMLTTTAAAGTSSAVPSATSAAALSPSASALTSSSPATHPATSSAPPSSSAAAPSTAPHTSQPPSTHPVTHPTSSPATHPAPPPVTGGSLPLQYSTGTATRVITVVSSGYSHTTATLQAWSKAPGGGWLRYGSAVTAHVGSDGMTTAPSEYKSATPIGSFSLTQAFGRLSNPGTPLPYFQTTPADWWISQSGPLYNTHQHCSSGCSFSQGSPNEHLYYETPYYNYAVVINTPSGASAYPHGSAFFLHVTDGNPTAGCVAIPSSNLVTLMRWLSPSTHPRILIGVT